MQHKVIIDMNVIEGMPMQDLKVGELGQVVSSGECSRQIILRTYNNFTVLNVPNVTYMDTYSGSIRVVRLEQGTVVKIIVGRG